MSGNGKGVLRAGKWVFDEYSDEYFDIGTHWVALYMQNNNSVTYFDSFGVEHS